MAIALEEANETEYWILLLRESGLINTAESKSFLEEVRQILKLLTSIIKSTKAGT